MMVPLVVPLVVLTDTPTDTLTDTLTDTPRDALWHAPRDIEAPRVDLRTDSRVEM